MHDDFKASFVRFHMLRLAEDQTLTADNFRNYFDSKMIKGITDPYVMEQLRHLEKEEFLTELSPGEYEITDKGKKEGLEVQHAIRTFFD